MLTMPHVINRLARAALDPERDGKLVEDLRDHPLPAGMYGHARMHGLCPLVYHTLDRIGLTEHLPDLTGERFKQVYYRALADNLRNHKALMHLRQTLSPDIPLLVLKGPALIDCIYHHPALRPMSDVDLLVRPEHLAEVKDYLRGLNYESPIQYPDIFESERVIFDLHTDPFHANRIAGRLEAVSMNVDRLWQEATPFSDTNHLYRPSMPDQVLTLAVHALKHGYERKLWLFDILFSLDQVSNVGGWEEIERHMRFHRALPIFAWGLHAIEMHLALPLPPEARAIQKSFPIGPIRRKILCASPGSGDFQILEPLVLMHQFQRFRDRIRFFISFAFPNRTALTQVSGLSGHLLILSVPFRILQILVLGTLQLLRLVLRMSSSHKS
jgi:hypothetical protein